MPAIKKRTVERPNKTTPTRRRKKSQTFFAVCMLVERSTSSDFLGHLPFMSITTLRPPPTQSNSETVQFITTHNHKKKKQNGMEKCGRTREKKKRRKMKEEKQVNKEIDKRIISAGACSCKIKSFSGREPQRISYSRRTSAQRRDRSTFPIISLSLFQKKNLSRHRVSY